MKTAETSAAQKGLAPAATRTEAQLVYVGKWKSKLGTLELRDDSSTTMAPPLGKVGKKYLAKMTDASLRILGTKIILKSDERTKEFKIDKTPNTKTEPEKWRSMVSYLRRVTQNSVRRSKPLVHAPAPGQPALQTLCFLLKAR